MAPARSSENSAHEGDHRGAAPAAPRSAPADEHLHATRSFLELLEIHRRVEREALAAEAQRLGLTNGDVNSAADAAAATHATSAADATGAADAADAADAAHADN